MWFCKKQGAASHSSSEVEIISLEACLRAEGLPAFMPWNLVCEVLCAPRGGRQVDYVPCTLLLSNGVAQLRVLEDNDPVIKMTVKGRSPSMRHAPRTHRIDLDRVFERIQHDPGVSIKYVGTKEQIADMFTKGSFGAEQWSKLLKLAQLIKLPQKAGGNIIIPRNKLTNKVCLQAGSAETRNTIDVFTQTDVCTCD